MANVKNELVVKSNRLIEASYRLTLAEQRIILFAITEARKTQRGLDSDTFVSIKAIDYAETFGIPANQAYEQIKDAALCLYERGFVLHDTHPESGKPRVIKARWVSSAAYIEGEGMVQLRFSHEVVPYVTKLETEFTRYKLEQIAGMSSPHAIRLYELLAQWGSAGKREITLENIRKVFALDNEYQRTDNLKKWVIDVAVSQINKHSDLTVSYTQRKTGRSVTHLTFTFAPKVATQPKAARRPRNAPAKQQGDDGRDTAQKAIKRTKSLVEDITKPKQEGDGARKVQAAREALAKLRGRLNTPLPATA